jgi:hypothetical protein
VGEYHAGSADGGERLAVFDYAGAYRSGCIVAGAADNHSSLAQSQGVCHFTGQPAGHFAGFIDLAQQCLVDLEQAQQFV